MSSSLREQAAQKEKEWRELEQLQYDLFAEFIYFIFKFFAISVTEKCGHYFLKQTVTILTAVLLVHRSLA